MFGLFLLIVIGAGVATFSSRRSRVHRSWAEVAARHGLETRTGGPLSHPSLHGTVSGTLVQVDVANISGSGNQAHTRYTVAHTPSGPPVKMTRQHTFSFVSRVFGGRDETVGDPRFDDNVVVDTSNVHTLSAFLTADRREAILGVFQTWPNAEITHSSIMVATKGVETDAGVMGGTIRRLVEVGHLLSTHAPPPEPSRPQPPPPRPRARPVSKPAPAQAPVPAPPPVPTALPPTPTPAPEPEPDPGPRIDQQATIDDLLGRSRMSSEVEGAFASDYAGRSVSWAGEVTQIRPFGRDRDFGTERGTRITLDIGTIGESGLMSSRVKAIVGFPENTRPGRGESLAFRGRLLRVDRSSRVIYIEDATVID